MASNTTLTTFDPALKQLYRPENVQDLTYNTHPFFGMIAKNESFGGRNMPIVIKYGNPVGGRSHSFAKAQANYSSVKLEDFLLTRTSNYMIARIDGEVIEATRGDTYAFLAALKEKTDGAFAALADSIEGELFRSGSGSLAQIGSISANVDGTEDRIILKQIEEVVNFEVDMVLVASAADGGALRATPGTATVTAVDRSLGYVQVTDLTAGLDWAADDYLYVEGDAQAAGTAVGMSGLAAWVPATVTSTAFFGVDRTVDSRLYGMSHDGTLDSAEEAAIDAQSKAAREGGKPDVYLMHNSQYRRLVKELGAKKVYTEVLAQSAKGSVPSVGYRGVVIEGDYGPIRCVAAPRCQATTGWMLTTSGWKLHTLGSATKFLMEDGLRILRLSTADGYELRMVSRGNVATRQPCWNVRVALPNP